MFRLLVALVDGETKYPSPKAGAKTEIGCEVIDTDKTLGSKFALGDKGET